MSDSVDTQKVVENSKRVFRFASSSIDERCAMLRDLLTNPPRSDDPIVRERFEVAFRFAEQAMVEQELEKVE